MQLVISNINLPDQENGKNLDDLRLQSGITISIVKKQIEELKQEPLLNIKEELTEKATKVFQESFERFSKDGKMSYQDCGEFTKAVLGNSQKLGNRSQNSVDEHVKILFDEYDPEKKGYITFDSFKTFYLKAAKKSPQVVWQNLNQLGYMKDLSKNEVSSNSDKTSINQLPRFILANTPKYFDLLFNLFSISI